MGRLARHFARCDHYEYVENVPEPDGGTSGTLITTLFWAGFCDSCVRRHIDNQIFAVSYKIKNCPQNVELVESEMAGMRRMIDLLFESNININIHVMNLLGSA